MDFQNVVNTLVAGGLAAIGWFARVLWEAVKDVRKELSTLREQIPEKYVSKDDFREAWREVRDLLRSINDKLDLKADK